MSVNARYLGFSDVLLMLLISIAVMCYSLYLVVRNVWGLKILNKRKKNPFGIDYNIFFAHVAFLIATFILGVIFLMSWVAVNTNDEISYELVIK